MNFINLLMSCNCITLKSENSLIETSILHNFDNTHILLYNKEKAQYIGKIESGYDYYLLEFNNKKIYIKRNQNGFGICTNTKELDLNELYIGIMNKSPNFNKINRTLSLIDSPNTKIYILNDGLKIIHLHSNYNTNESNEVYVHNSEYILLFNNYYTVLSYNNFSGYSLISKKISL
jgi:hypothetical protein